MKNKLKKIGGKIGVFLLKKVGKKVEEIKDDNVREGAEILLQSSVDTIVVLTDNDPNDAEQLKVIIEALKEKGAELGIDTAKKIIEKKIKDPETRDLILELIDMAVTQDSEPAMPS